MKSRSRFRLWSLLLLATGGMALAACGGSNYSVSSVDSSVSSASSSQSSSEPSTPAHVHHWGDPTWEWHQDGDSFHVHAVFTCLDDASHVEEVDANVVCESVSYATCESNGSATYVATVEHGGNTFSASQTITLPATQHEIETKWSFDNTKHWHVCAHDATEHFDEAPHQLATRYNVTSEPSCVADGSRTEETYCVTCGAVISTKRSVMRALNHDYHLVEEECVAPTCLKGGKNVYKCEICGKTYTQSLSALGHDFGNGPTCTQDAHCSRQDCNAVMPATGHNYQKVDEQPASCTQKGSETYRCLNCNDQFVSEIPSTGHQLSNDWTYDRSEPVENETCKFVDVYTNECATCGEVVEKEIQVTRHNLIAKITKEATCQEAGEKQYVCKDCGYVDAGHTEVLPKNPDAHNFDEGHEEGGYMIFTCQNAGCGAKKKSFVGVKQAQVDASVFAEAEEIKMEEAALSFDADSKELLQDKDLIVNVDKNTAEELSIDREDIPADTEIFDFSLTDHESGEKAEFSDGEKGQVTIRIPYQLKDGEDADAIIVYYINQDTGELEEVNARYENGFAVFETSHFSLYYVSYMTPEMACKKLGHRYGETYKVEATCVSAGYSYKTCARCGFRDVTDVVNPLGHDWQPGAGAVAPTCTQPGHSDYQCSRCDAEYGANLAPKGHDYQQVTIPATCEESGKVIYTCHNCDDEEPGHTYEVSIPELGHNYQPDVQPSSCIEHGKIQYKCVNCGAVDESLTEELALVPHDYKRKSEDDSKIVYECSMCHKEFEVSKNAADLTKDFRYTQTAKSIVGQDLTILGNDITFQLKDENNPFLLKVKSAEGHIGVDENKNLVLYGNSDVDMSSGTGSHQYHQVGKVAAMLSGSRMYILNDFGTPTYQMFDLTTVNMGPDVSIASVLERFPQLIDYLENSVRPWIEELLDYNSAEINQRIFHLISRFCDYKASPEGYEITLSFAKLAQFAEMVKTASIAECVDYAFGEGTVDSFFADIDHYVSDSFYDALAYLKQKTGIDYKVLLGLADQAIAIFTPYETLRDYIYDQSHWTVDINQYLSETYLKAHSISGLIKENNVWANVLGDHTLAYFIAHDVREMLNENLYALLEDKANAPHDTMVEVQGHIDRYLSALRGKGNALTLVIDAQGNYKSFRISLNLDTDEVLIQGSLDFIFSKDYRSLFDYSKMMSTGESILDGIYQANFSSNEKIINYFGGRATYFKDESGKITKVTIVQTNPAPVYEGKASGPIVVQSERDLFAYANLNSYARLRELYDQYRGKGIIYLTPGDYRIYEIDSFTPSMLMYQLICGNRYQVQFSLSSLYRSIYNGIKFEVRDTGNPNTILYEEILDNSTYSRYQTNYGSGQGTINLATKEFDNHGYPGHRYTLSEASSEAEIEAMHCGDLIVKKWVCIDCGDVKDESYLKGHTPGEEVSYEYATDVHDCASGVIHRYECVDCHEQLEEIVHDHDLVNHQELPLNGGATMILDTCYCGGNFKVSFEGFVADPEGQPYLELQDEGFVEGTIYESIENGVLFYAIRSQYEGCLEKLYAVTYEGIVFGEEATTFTHKTETLIGTRENHNLYNDLFTLKAVEGGYEYCLSCRNCDYAEKVVAKELDYYGMEFRGYVKDLGYPMVKGYVSAYGVSFDKDGAMIAEKIDYNFESCDFYPEVKEDNFARFVCVVTDPEVCGFAYETKMAQSQNLGDCRYARFNLYRFGVKEDGTAAFEICGNYYTTQQHRYNSGVNTTVPTGYPSLELQTTTYTCADCGATTTNTRAVVAGETPLTEETREVKDGLTYVYPSGYYKNAELMDGDSYWGEVKVYDAQGTLVRSYRNAFYLGHYYSYSMGQSSSGYSVRLSKTETLYSTYQGESFRVRYNQSDSSWQENQGVIDKYSSSTEYYYPFYQAETFGKLFKQVTGYDYDLERYGCYLISLSNQDNRPLLEEYHLLERPSSTYYCTQPLPIECVICGHVRYDSPIGHQFIYDHYDEEAYRDIYVCQHCGQESWSRYDGRFSLEILPDDKDNSILIGYGYRNRMGISLQDLKREFNTRFDLYAYDKEGREVRLDLPESAIVDEGDGVACKFSIDTNEIALALLKQEEIAVKDLEGLNLVCESWNFYYNLLIPAAEVNP